MNQPNGHAIIKYWFIQEWPSWGTSTGSHAVNEFQKLQPISGSRPNHVCAQEIQSQCNDGCANQTITLMNDQIKNLFGSDKSDEDFRYGIDAILKSGQTKWKYSEKNITNLDNITVYIAIICGNELSEKVPTLQKEKEDVLTLRVRTGSEPCDLTFLLLRDSGLPTQSILIYTKKNLTNTVLSLKIYRYHPEKRHHRDIDASVLVAG